LCLSTSQRAVENTDVVAKKPRLAKSAQINSSSRPCSGSSAESGRPVVSSLESGSVERPKLARGQEGRITRRLRLVGLSWSGMRRYQSTAKISLDSRWSDDASANKHGDSQSKPGRESAPGSSISTRCIRGCGNRLRFIRTSVRIQTLEREQLSSMICSRLDYCQSAV